MLIKLFSFYNNTTLLINSENSLSEDMEHDHNLEIMLNLLLMN